MTTSSSGFQSERRNAFVTTRPVLVAITFFAMVVALRLIDAFALKLDTLPERYIISRLVGLLVVLPYLRTLRRPMQSLGFHTNNLDKAFLVGAVSLVLLNSTLYAVQFYRLSTANEYPHITFGAIDSSTGAIGQPFFTAFYIFGQIVNALMEEAIFRGIMLPLLMAKFRFGLANGIQALLFGLAHLVYPLESWAIGQALAGEVVAEAASLLVFTTVGGLVFGYLYYRTGNLWTAVLAHLTDSFIGLFIHIQTPRRVNAETDIQLLASLGFVALVVLTWIVAKRSHLSTLKPWDA